MIKAILSTVTILFFIGIYQPVSAQAKQVSLNSSKGDVKFLDDISVEVAPINTSNSDPSTVFTSKKSETVLNSKKVVEPSSKPDIEAAQKLQFKYALILDTEVEMVKNINLVSLIDEWMGTRYRLGGTSKSGIDCSAFMQVLFTGIYGISLPRTAREQYNMSQRISRTDLKEGDLIFFNTTGGVSHVGMYLQNNKFVHASSSGVTISDIFDEYWVKRFIGVGRVQDSQESSVLISRL
ncbi:C40 family peptidase [Flavisolibacter ginsengisoli]|jgi:lipoprotein Spr|uniref:Lipoprotein Spr n=1 Tax=Flavisolibacter ginsengisoli DSM 18119 TaxID=1121884 RepID=A0A1M4Z2G9_9BACT|nr:NlpC/P60 family protein [Flavisolibacter ginsengisoli]SHF11932.1 lipoprotein Spr [Flavisolibacter ginsengisoli DSM 18119]